MKKRIKKMTLAKETLLDLEAVKVVGANETDRPMLCEQWRDQSIVSICPCTG